MREWRSRYGQLPSSYDWSRAHARARGGEALERLASGEWPAASVVSRMFGTWPAARLAASGEDVDVSLMTSPSEVGLIGHTADLYAQSTAIVRKIRGSEEVRLQP
jgi:hypothetical protein